ncbi:MAG TPA: CHASE2 domain-containing protein, partial [Stenomitos sp.]
QPANNRRSSLSDRDLLKLLQKIVHLQPSVVGLDIYRDFPVEPQYPELAQQLRQNSKLITVCKSRDATGDPVGVSPPKESPVEQLGFSDFIEDNDGILRRQILFMTPDPLSPCPAYYGFGAQVALRYLADQGIQPEFTANGDLKLKSTLFRRMQPFMGAYQSSTEGGHQMMLNFRALPNPQDIATQVSLSDVLNDRVSADLVKNRAILIGVNANSSSDFWGTPYGAGGLHKTSGIFIQAHMASQILSAVLDRRPTISPGNFWTDGLWLWGFGALGGMIVQVFRSVRYSVQSSVLACGLLISIGLVALVQGIWIPVVPAMLTFGTTAAMIGYQKLRNTQELVHLPQQSK